VTDVTKTGLESVSEVGSGNTPDCVLVKDAISQCLVIPGMCRKARLNIVISAIIFRGGE